MPRLNRIAALAGPALLLAAALGATPVFAQTNGADNPECLGDSCGRPKEEGGGCGCGCGCSVWVAYTDDGTTLSYTDDADGDGRADDRDNCPFASNRDQSDTDGDGVGNSCDNCASSSNFTQLDSNGDGEGNACDADRDGDTIPNDSDNCADVANQGQRNSGGLAAGDACDADDDGDGVLDGQDNCPLVSNPDGIIPAGATCNVDSDGDGLGDGYDNCPNDFNQGQDNTDRRLFSEGKVTEEDAMGDACDPDLDNDGVLNTDDNCDAHPNADQLDDDGDAAGDACDARYCVVVDASNPDDCLDPKSPFKVHAGGSLGTEVGTGEEIRPPLFANRNGAAIEYTWTVTRRPEGSRAAVRSPNGSVGLSRHWEYAYPDGHVPSFVPDVPGDYELQLTATLAFPERDLPRTSTSTLRFVAANKGLFACGVAPAGPVGALALLALGSLLRRRKQRQ